MPHISSSSDRAVASNSSPTLTSNGTTGVRFERAAVFERPELKTLNARLSAEFVVGDQVAIPKAPADSFSPVSAAARAASAAVALETPSPAAAVQTTAELIATLDEAKGEIASLKRMVAGLQAVPSNRSRAVDESFTKDSKTGLAAGESFSWEKLGRALIEDADSNIQRLASEQDAVGAKYTGLKRELMGGLAAGGGFAGKFFHSLERLVGMGLFSVAGSINDPDRIAAAVRAIRDNVSLNGLGNLLQGFGQNAFEAYARRGFSAVAVEGTLNAITFSGAGVASQVKVLNTVADAAVEVVGHERQISKWSEYAKKALQHSQVLGRIADNAAAPFVATHLVPGFNVTRASLTANAVSNQATSLPMPAVVPAETAASQPK